MSIQPLTIRRPDQVHMLLPVSWLEHVSQLLGKSLHVGIVLMYLAAIRKSAEVRFSLATLRRFSTSRDASYDALRRMAAVGLVHMTKSPGRSPVVTLLNADGRKLVL